jgi:hypothetical protein
LRKVNLQQIEARIAAIKQEFLSIGEMRPGSITRQYKDPTKKAGGSYQISYTHHMKSRTEYVRPQFVKMLEEQVECFAQFRKLTQEWIDLAIEHSKLKIKLEIEKEKEKAKLLP